MPIYPAALAERFQRNYAPYSQFTRKECQLYQRAWKQPGDDFIHERRRLEKAEGQSRNDLNEAQDNERLRRLWPGFVDLQPKTERDQTYQTCHVLMLSLLKSEDEDSLSSGDDEPLQPRRSSLDNGKNENTNRRSSSRGHKQYASDDEVKTEDEDHDDDEDMQPLHLQRPFATIHQAKIRPSSNHVAPSRHGVRDLSLSERASKSPRRQLATKVQDKKSRTTHPNAHSHLHTTNDGYLGDSDNEEDHGTEDSLNELDNDNLKRKSVEADTQPPKRARVNTAHPEQGQEPLRLPVPACRSMPVHPREHHPFYPEDKSSVETRVSEHETNVKRMDLHGSSTGATARNEFTKPSTTSKSLLGLTSLAPHFL